MIDWGDSVIETLQLIDDRFFDWVKQSISQSRLAYKTGWGVLVIGTREPVKFGWLVSVN